MMHREMPHSPGSVRGHAVAAAIGKGLAEIFEFDLRSPMPERLAALLDACERRSGRDAAPKPGDTQAN
jgi:hypothetical protein